MSNQVPSSLRASQLNGVGEGLLDDRGETLDDRGETLDDSGVAEGRGLSLMTYLWALVSPPF